MNGGKKKNKFKRQLVNVLKLLRSKKSNLNVHIVMYNFYRTLKVKFDQY